MKYVFVFPGQGSQYVGMGKDLYNSYESAREIFKRADEILGFSLSNLCFSGPAEELDLTVNTQPAVLAVSLACFALLHSHGVSPSAVAGHSLGEYSALVAAGSLSMEDALGLVRKRGRYMQEAVPAGRGGMYAVLGLSAGAVTEVCSLASASGVVEAVNLNCPGQVVIAGENDALEQAKSLAIKAGAKRCLKLPVSAPFHSSLMKPAGMRLASDLSGVKLTDPAVPLVANVSADFVRTASGVRDALVQQIFSPVRWEESIRRLVESGFEAYIEVGPGRVLGGLVRKIHPAATVLNIEDGSSLEKVLAHVGEVG
ncbi:MAG: ACP S-malonyltransferase [Firmicutes bacterium]|nr:ACP S-malonyltransferase [Bacillota bacterium]